MGEVNEKYQGFGFKVGFKIINIRIGTETIVINGDKVKVKTNLTTLLVPPSKLEEFVALKVSDKDNVKYALMDRFEYNIYTHQLKYKVHHIV